MHTNFLRCKCPIGRISYLADLDQMEHRLADYQLDCCHSELTALTLCSELLQHQKGPLEHNYENRVAQLLMYGKLISISLLLAPIKMK